MTHKNLPFHAQYGRERGGIFISSVFQRLHGGGDASAAGDHHGGAVGADGHDGRVAQKAAEIQHIAAFFAETYTIVTNTY